jgi:peptidoglycan/LPS O-acetylase OafA/YrhL
MHAWGVSDRWAWNYPSWSISAEWAGYLSFPLLWAVLRGQNAIGLAVVLPLTLLGVGAVRAIAHAQDLSLTYDGGVMRLFPEFIAGIAILPLLPRLPRRLNGYWLAAAGGSGAVLAAIAGSETATIAALWVLLLGLLLAGEQGRRPALARVPGLRWLGEISYSYYMSFALVETLQATVWRHLNLLPEEHRLAYMASTTAGTLTLATLAWALVERPSLRAFAAISRRRARQRPDRAATREIAPSGG